MTSAASTRRDQLLRQLGITQYQLVRPAVLRGEVNLALPDACRLIVVAPIGFDVNTSCFQDILRAMNLTNEQMYLITSEQIMMLHDVQHYALLIMGELTDDSQLPMAACLLTCPELRLFSQQPTAKQQLWQQICHYEHYFFPHAR